MFVRICFDNDFFVLPKAKRTHHNKHRRVSPKHDRVPRKRWRSCIGMLIAEFGCGRLRNRIRGGVRLAQWSYISDISKSIKCCKIGCQTTQSITPTKVWLQKKRVGAKPSTLTKNFPVCIENLIRGLLRARVRAVYGQNNLLQKTNLPELSAHGTCDYDSNEDAKLVWQ